MIIVDDISLYYQCATTAENIFNNHDVFAHIVDGFDNVESLTKSLYDSEMDRRKLVQQSDAFIDFNDEIESIEYLDEEIEMQDITVSGSNLFYANGILTKNSFGIAMTADMMFGMISTPELDELGHLRLKQLKNRFGDINKPSSFIVSINRAKMQLRDLDVIATPPARNQQQAKELNTSSKASKLKF